jgi:hypothetical protein
VVFAATVVAYPDGDRFAVSRAAVCRIFALSPQNDPQPGAGPERV